MEIPNTKTRILQPVLAPPPPMSSLSEIGNKVLDALFKEWSHYVTDLSPLTSNSLNIESMPELSQIARSDDIVRKESGCTRQTIPKHAKVWHFEEIPESPIQKETFSYRNQERSIIDEIPDSPVNAETFCRFETNSKYQKKIISEDIPESYPRASLKNNNFCEKMASVNSVPTDLSQHLDDWIEENIYNPSWNSDMECSPPFENMSAVVPSVILPTIEVNMQKKSINPKMDLFQGRKLIENLFENKFINKYPEINKNKKCVSETKLGIKTKPILKKPKADPVTKKKREGYILEVSKTKPAKLSKIRQTKITDILSKKSTCVDKFNADKTATDDTRTESVDNIKVQVGANFKKKIKSKLDRFKKVDELSTENDVNRNEDVQVGNEKFGDSYTTIQNKCEVKGTYETKVTNLSETGTYNPKMQKLCITDYFRKNK